MRRLRLSMYVLKEFWLSSPTTAIISIVPLLVRKITRHTFLRTCIWITLLGLVCTTAGHAAIPALCPADPFSPTVNPNLQTALNNAEAAYLAAQTALAGTNPILFVAALELFGQEALAYFLQVAQIAGSNAIAGPGTPSKQCCLKGGLNWESVVNELVLVVAQYQGIANGGKQKFGDAGRSPLSHWYEMVVSPANVQAAISDYLYELSCSG
jgi:hypothetical protein